MMMSSIAYKMLLTEKTYEELLIERDRLYDYIKQFETNQIPDKEWEICPSPDVIYQEYHEYLGELMPMISEKFNEKYEQCLDDVYESYKEDLSKRQGSLEE